MCLCGTDVQYSNFVSPDGYQYRLQLSTDSKFCMQLGTHISTPTTRMPFIRRLHFIYQSTGQIISFQMMPPLRSFDDVGGKERGQKKTDDLRAMTTLGPRTLISWACFTRHTMFNLVRFVTVARQICYLKPFLSRLSWLTSCQHMPNK